LAEIRILLFTIKLRPAFGSPTLSNPIRGEKEDKEKTVIKHCAMNTYVEMDV
jgi:hypothetical protein